MRPIKIILHPTDFTPASEEAFRVACGLARDRFALLIVLHVLPPSQYMEPESSLRPDDVSDRRTCQVRFQQMAALAGDIPISFQIATGYAVGIISEIARNEQADLIVLASHHQKLPLLQLHGSVAEGLLRLAPCPVLCLRAKSDDLVTFAKMTKRTFNNEKPQPCSQCRI